MWLPTCEIVVHRVVYIDKTDRNKNRLSKSDSSQYDPNYFVLYQGAIAMSRYRIAPDMKSNECNVYTNNDKINK